MKTKEEYLIGVQFPNSRSPRDFNMVLIAMQKYAEDYHTQFSQPSEQTESAELTDLKQYVTNLLYFAHSVSSDDFDAWVEEQTNNLDQYFQSHPEAREMPSDEEILKLLTDYELYCNCLVSEKFIIKFIKQRNNGK